MEFNPTKIGGLDYSEDDEIGYFYTLQVVNFNSLCLLRLFQQARLFYDNFLCNPIMG